MPHRLTSHRPAKWLLLIAFALFAGATALAPGQDTISRDPTQVSSSASLPRYRAEVGSMPSDRPSLTSAQYIHPGLVAALQLMGAVAGLIAHSRDAMPDPLTDRISAR